VAACLKFVHIKFACSVWKVCTVTKALIIRMTKIHCGHMFALADSCSHARIKLSTYWQMHHSLSIWVSRKWPSVKSQVSVKPLEASVKSGLKSLLASRESQNSDWSRDSIQVSGSSRPFSNYNCLKLINLHLASVLWRYWLGVRKSIRPVKNWVIRCWHGSVWSDVQMIWGPADATATPSSCVLLKSRLV